MDRGLWAGVWGVVMATASYFAFDFWKTNAQATQTEPSSVPMWPAYVFGFIAVLGLFMVFAPLFHYWPFRSARVPRQANPPRDEYWEPSAWNTIGQGVPSIALALYPP